MMKAPERHFYEYYTRNPLKAANFASKAFLIELGAIALYKLVNSSYFLELVSKM